MNGFPFLAGAILGGAFIAAVYDDKFRNTCKDAIGKIVKEADKQVEGMAKQADGAIRELTNGQK